MKKSLSALDFGENIKDCILDFQSEFNVND